ncbi:MAG: diguanylate cyclase [Thalassotalea sp.]|nr:diguanylate cyclase [Thalassotalea sp.]
MLISCQSIAFQAIKNNTFDAFIKKAELLKDTHTADAFTFLYAQSNNISSLTIENQLIFNKLLAELYVEQAQYQKSINLATDALKLARKLSSPSITTSELLYARGFAIESLGDYQAAREDYLNGLEIADSLNNKKIVAIGLVNIGALNYLMEKFDRALIMFNDALAIAQKINDDELLGFIYGEMGILYSLINQEEKSLSYHKSAYEYYQKAGKIFYAFNTLRNIASSHSVNERYEEAILVYEQILEDIDKISNNELISSIYAGMAWAHIKKEDSDPEASYQYMLIASQYIEQAEQVDIPIAHALDKGYLFMELGRYEEALESMHIATEYLKKYEGSEQKVVSTISRINLLYLKAETYFKIENYQQAYLAQDEFLTFALSLPEKSNFDGIEDLRMRYESEQADLQKKILEQKESVQSLLLSEAKSDAKDRKIFIFVFALIALVLAWILIKIINGQKKLLIATRTDSLTNVANRRRLMQLGNDVFKQAKEEALLLSLFIVDVDDFKKVNDTYGHKVGDQTLKAIASLGQEHMRDTDVFGRFGGEEFVALLPNTTIEQAQEIAERLRSSAEQYTCPNNQINNISLSIGVVHYNQTKHQTFEELLKDADLLMYQAKRQGKNKVCINE